MNRFVVREVGNEVIVSHDDDFDSERTDAEANETKINLSSEESIIILCNNDPKTTLHVNDGGARWHCSCWRGAWRSSAVHIQVIAFEAFSTPFGAQRRRSGAHE